MDDLWSWNHMLTSPSTLVTSPSPSAKPNSTLLLARGLTKALLVVAVTVAPVSAIHSSSANLVTRQPALSTWKRCSMRVPAAVIAGSPPTCHSSLCALPMAQSEHVILPVSGFEEPAGHAVHVLLLLVPTSVPTLPGAQPRHEVFLSSGW